MGPLRHNGLVYDGAVCGKNALSTLKLESRVSNKAAKAATCAQTFRVPTQADFE